MDVIDLRPDLRMLLGSPGQAYLLRHPGGVLLVDSGPPGGGADIAQALAGWGLGRDAVTHVLLTHWHADHTGAAAEVARWGAARVYAGRADAPVIRGELRGADPVFTDAERALHPAVSAGLTDPDPCRVDVELDDGDRIEELGAVVVATPGHTDGSIALHLPDAGVLFTGDVAAEYEGHVILGPFHTDRAMATASFRRFAGLAADTVCFGHGQPLRGPEARRLHEAATADVVPDPLG